MGLALAVSDPKPVTDPWERQASETEEAWLAFRAYREMIPQERRIKHAATKAIPTLSKWYRDHSWEERCKAYDAKFDKIDVEERERMYRRKAKEIAIDHMSMLSNARELVQRELTKLLETSRQSEMHGLIKPRELQGLFEMVIKLDRLVRGETTENVGTTIDYSGLNPDELETLEKLLTKATKKSDDAGEPVH